MPSRTQITRHDCVEGWSAIGKWKGVPLAPLLDRVGVKSEARYVVFHCFDTMEQGLAGPVKYYESLDFIDARHPQTILAYDMNDTTLPVAHGAPLRLRVERQLGYKMAKYVHAYRTGRRLFALRRRQGQLLGRPRLRLVRRHLGKGVAPASGSVTVGRMGIKTIITGATGMVGEGVLLECLANPARRAGSGDQPQAGLGARTRSCAKSSTRDFFDLAPIRRSLPATTPASSALASRPSA